MSKFFLILFWLVTGLLSPVGAQRSTRILLIPLDDRPPCLQFPTLLGRVGAAEVVTPPRGLLGRFTEPGQPERIAEWLKKQNLKSFDAAILSLDMLAYGGLVASRVHNVTQAEAERRLAILEWLRQKAPRLPLYGSSVIMRLAPTGDGKNEAYREKLARWAEISPDEKLKDETKRLEKEIPPAALADYKQARRRNVAINLEALQKTRRGVLRYTIFSQDDAHPRGVHLADRERLIAEAKQLGVGDKIAIQPGADEVSMLLLARALTTRFKYNPRIHAIYSSDAIRQKVFPYEDREINRTVSFHIAAAGGVEVATQEEADILFFVYGSRKEAGAAATFAAQVAQAVKTRRRVIVADVDPLGDVQGADPVFMAELRRLKVLPQLSGLGAWNTAGNAIGTALPHGIIYNVALNRLPKRARQYEQGQLDFLLNRLLDDYAYHSLVRPDALTYMRTQGWSALRLDEEKTRAITDYCLERMLPHVNELLAEFGRAPAELDNFSFTLPWGRTFEAEINVVWKRK